MESGISVWLDGERADSSAPIPTKKYVLWKKANLIKKKILDFSENLNFTRIWWNSKLCWHLLFLTWPRIYHKLDKTFVHLKILTSVVFAFNFRNLTMWQIFFMSQTFSMFQKTVWDIEKCLYLCFLLHKSWKKIRQKRQSPNIVFSEKNIEKVWDIEKLCNMAKFRKPRQKNESQHFSMLKFSDGQA